VGTGAPTRPPTRHARQHTPALQTPQNTANLLHLDDDPLAAAAAAPAEEATAAAESKNMGAAASAAAAAAAEGEQEVAERDVDLALAPPTEDESTPEAAATKAQPADLAAPKGADDAGQDAIPDGAPAGQQAAAPADAPIESAPAAIAGDGQGSAGTAANRSDADLQPAEREVSSPHVGDAVAAGAAVTEAIPTAAEPGDEAETPNADHRGAVPDFETPQPAEAMTEDEVVAVWRGPTVRLSQDHDDAQEQ